MLEFSYLQLSAVGSEVQEKKRLFVKTIGLPDLAIASQNYASRHRTLSGVFDIYPDDGSLREYSNSSFAISHSTIENKKSLTNEK